MNVTKLAKRVRSASPFRRAPSGRELIEQIRMQEMELRQNDDGQANFHETQHQPQHVDRYIREMHDAQSYHYRERSESEFIYDPRTASLSAFGDASSERHVEPRKSQPAKISHQKHGHDIQTLSTESSSERDSHEAIAIREVEKRKAFRDRFMKPQQHLQEASRPEDSVEGAGEQVEPIRGRSRSLRKVLSGKSSRERDVDIYETNLGQSSPDDNHLVDGKQRSNRDKKLEESRLRRKMKEKAKKNRPKSKLALTLIACANKAQDHEYEQFLARQQLPEPLEYEVIAEFNGPKIQTQVDNGLSKRIATIDRKTSARKPADIDLVTVRHSHNLKHSISELTGPNGPIVTEKVLREQDIKSIRDTLSQIERNLKDATRRGRKVSRAEMVNSLSSVASSLDISVDQLLTGQIIGSRVVPATRLETIESISGSPDEDIEDDYDSDIVAPSVETSPSHDSGVQSDELISDLQPGGDCENEDDDDEDASGSDDSEFTKWAYELEDDDSRDARNFVRELFSSLSAISRTINVSRAQTEEATFVPIQSTVSNASQFVRTDRTSHLNETTPITRRAVSFKEHDRLPALTLDPAIRSTDKARPVSPVTLSSSVHLNSYDRFTEHKLKPRRARSWQRISQGVSPPPKAVAGPKNASPSNSANPFQCGGRTFDNRDCRGGSWSDSSESESEYEESTVSPEPGGLTGAVHTAFRPLLQNPFKNLEAACGSIDHLVIGMEHVRRGEFCSR